GDRLVIGDTDDQAFLTLQELGLYAWNHGGGPFFLRLDDLALRIALSHLLEVAKRLAPILGILDVRDLPTVEFQMAFAPGSHLNLKLVCTDGCDEFLNGAPFPTAKPSFD